MKQKESDLQKLLGPLTQRRAVQQMKNYTQHGSTSTYDHCLRVAKTCYRLNRRLNLGCKERVLVRAAMLHDFYLYDWHRRDSAHRWHGFRHPKWAAANAAKHFHAAPQEQAVIRSHMWPLTLFALPASREAWLVCLVDKYCTLAETFHGKK